jgi:hypothetical protein
VVPAVVLKHGAALAPLASLEEAAETLAANAAAPNTMREHGDGTEIDLRSPPGASEAPAAPQQGKGPKFILNTLEVRGPREPLHAFVAAASGPGFIDWRHDWYSVYEHMYFV